MILKISYAEFSLLRELVREKQMELWKTRWLPALRGRDSMTPVEIREAFDREMNAEVPDWVAIVDDKQCCSVLLRRFDTMETELQAKMRKEELSDAA